MQPMSTTKADIVHTDTACVHWVFVGTYDSTYDGYLCLTMTAVVHPTNRSSMMTAGVTVPNECVWQQPVRRQCTIGHTE